MCVCLSLEISEVLRNLRHCRSSGCPYDLCLWNCFCFMFELYWYKHFLLLSLSLSLWLSLSLSLSVYLSVRPSVPSLSLSLSLALSGCGWVCFNGFRNLLLTTDRIRAAPNVRCCDSGRGHRQRPTTMKSVRVRVRACACVLRGNLIHLRYLTSSQAALAVTARSC